MSRSKKKTPIFGNTTVVSEKQDKRKWNKRFRKVSKSLLLKDKETPQKLASVTNVWEGSKDGKRYWKNYSLKDLRK